jgi:hypothetical protein
MRPVLLLDPQTSAQPDGRRWPGLGDVEIVDLYRLGQPDLDLEPYAVLAVAGMVDQEHLWAHRAAISSFLARRRTVVFCGQLFRRWLPGCEPFVPATISRFGDYAVHLALDGGQPHPIFAGVDPRDLTFRRGVAGFFARVHHPPPAGSRILATLAGGQPITWIDQVTTPGTVFVHAGADLLGYGADDASAHRLVPQLLDWACDQGTSR